MAPIAVLMIIFAAALFVYSGLVYKGETGLIRTFSQSKVKDKKAYARYLGKSIASAALVILICGLIGLIIKILIALIIMVILLCLDFYLISKYADKYYK